MEAGVNEYYAGQPVVMLGLDTYNGSSAAVESFRTATGVTFPLLLQGGGYAGQNSASYRKVVIDPDGIVRYVSGQYELNINTIRNVVDQWLPLDEPTFNFTMHDTLISYENAAGEVAYVFHGVVDNLLNEERQLLYTLSGVTIPDPLRVYAICTFVTCYPPDTTTYDILETYEPMAHDTNVSAYIYNFAYNTETGLVDTSTVHGNYVVRLTVSNPDDEEESISYDLYLDQMTGVTPRVVPVPRSTALVRNYPNPFNPETTIEFVVSNPGAVELNVFNMLGQNVASLVNTPFMSNGTYSSHWKAVNAQGLPLPSGNYLVELNNAGLRAVHKVLLVR